MGFGVGAVAVGQAKGLGVILPYYKRIIFCGAQCCKLFVKTVVSAVQYIIFLQYFLRNFIFNFLQLRCGRVVAKLFYNIAQGGITH